MARCCSPPRRWARRAKDHRARPAHRLRGRHRRCAVLLRLAAVLGRQWRSASRFRRRGWPPGSYWPCSKAAGCAQRTRGPGARSPTRCAGGGDRRCGVRDGGRHAVGASSRGRPQLRAAVGGVGLRVGPGSADSHLGQPQAVGRAPDRPLITRGLCGIPRDSFSLVTSNVVWAAVCPTGYPRHRSCRGSAIRIRPARERRSTIEPVKMWREIGDSTPFGLLANFGRLGHP